jgi:hypothetical protein
MLDRNLAYRKVNGSSALLKLILVYDGFPVRRLRLPPTDWKSIVQFNSTLILGGHRPLAGQIAGKPSCRSVDKATDRGTQYSSQSGFDPGVHFGVYEHLPAPKLGYNSEFNFSTFRVALQEI